MKTRCLRYREEVQDFIGCKDRIRIMNKVNYQKELEKILQKYNRRDGENPIPEYSQPPRLFLHSCCAPCSSYCLDYLCQYFAITVFYYNPNISMEEEYRKRVAEQKRLIAAYN